MSAIRRIERLRWDELAKGDSLASNTMIRHRDQFSRIHPPEDAIFVAIFALLFQPLISHLYSLSLSSRFDAFEFHLLLKL